jgi:hypothetical protein
MAPFWGLGVINKKNGVVFKDILIFYSHLKRFIKRQKIINKGLLKNYLQPQSGLI